MRLRYLLIASFVLLGGSFTAFQQTAARRRRTPTPPQFRSTTDLVLMDVSVLDKSRRPIKGLTEADFTILEDGVPQPIATFAAVNLPEAEVPPAKWMGRASIDVQSNRMPDGRLVVIYLDERMVNASPFGGKTTTDTAHAIIDQLSPKDVAAVAFALDHKGAQEFTTDRGRLHAAVDTFSASGYVPISIVGTLGTLSQLLGSIPERRKVIIYIGAGQFFSTEVLGTMEKVTTQLGVSSTFVRQEQQDQFNSLLGSVPGCASRQRQHLHDRSERPGRRRSQQPAEGIPAAGRQQHRRSRRDRQQRAGLGGSEDSWRERLVLSDDVPIDEPAQRRQVPQG